MTNTEQAKMAGLEGTTKYMSINSAAYAGVTIITDSKTAFDASYDDTKKKAAAAKVDNTGFSEAKLEKKGLMIEEAAAISGYAKQDWDTEQPELAGQLHDNESDYALADSDCAALAMSVFNVLNDNSGELNPEHVSDEELAAFLLLITGFSSAEGSSDAAHEAKPESTTAFKKSLAATLKKQKKMVKACKKVRKTQPKFYNGLLLVAEIPTITIRHTHIHLTVKKKADGTPLEGVMAIFSNSVKTPVSDVNGLIIVDEIRGGNATLTLKKDGYIDLVVEIHINGGKDNEYVMEMVGA